MLAPCEGVVSAQGTTPLSRRMPKEMAGRETLQAEIKPGDDKA